jgi:[protein-PII] uridylyltransferase
VKDGKGGMRDLHTLFWIAKFVYGTRSVSELYKSGLFTRREQNRFIKCEDFLWAVRCHLHFLTGRPDDRLGFDKQAEMAERLGYASHGGLKSVERFMKHYFLIAKDVGDLTRIMSAVLEAQQFKKAPSMSDLIGKFRRRSIRLDDEGNYVIEAGRLKARHNDIFERIRSISSACSAWPSTITSPSIPDTLQEVRRSRRLIDKALAQQPAGQRAVPRHPHNVG